VYRTAFYNGYHVVAHTEVEWKPRDGYEQKVEAYDKALNSGTLKNPDPLTVSFEQAEATYLWDQTPAKIKVSSINTSNYFAGEKVYSIYGSGS
jgi:hypothetical protein